MVYIPEMNLIRTLRILTLMILPLGSSLSIDMYLPAYQDIAREYLISEGWVNLSMGIYLLGLAIGQLIYGPISDQVGRRPPLLVGLFLFLIATIGCQLAGTYFSFMIWRLLQALGACAAIVLVRAIVMDRYSHARQLRLLALISAINIFSPALAPLIGGVMLQWVSWHMIFASIAGYALLTLCMCYALIPETHTNLEKNALCIRSLKRNAIQILSHQRFTRYNLCVAFLYGVAFIWVTLSPIIVLHEMQVSKAYFGLVFMMQCIGNTSGALLAALFTSESGIKKVKHYGFLIFIISTLLFIGLVLTHQLHLNALLILIVVIYFAVGIVQPSLIQAAIEQFSTHRGFATGILGSTQTLFGMLTTLITGYFYELSSVAMAILLGIYCFAAYFLLPDRQR